MGISDSYLIDPELGVSAALVISTPVAHRCQPRVVANPKLIGTDGRAPPGFNEIQVSASHNVALITSLPFVHTARRYYLMGKMALEPYFHRKFHRYQYALN